MAIVHIGKLPLQGPESGSTEFVFGLVEQMRSMILQLVSRCLEESLETELDRMLGRKRYVRRRRAKRKEAVTFSRFPPCRGFGLSYGRGGAVVLSQNRTRDHRHDLPGMRTQCDQRDPKRRRRGQRHRRTRGPARHRPMAI